MLSQAFSQHGVILGIELTAAAVFLAMLFSVFRETRNGNTESEYMLWLALGLFCYVAFDVFAYIFKDYPYYQLYYKIALALSNIAMETTLLVYNFILIDQLRKKTYVDRGVLVFACIMTIAPAIFLTVGLFVTPGWIYADTSLYEPLWGYNVIMAFYIVLLMFDAILVISCHRIINDSEMLAWISYIVFPVLAAAMDNQALIVLSALVSYLLLYINIHVQQVRSLAEAEKKLSQSNAQLMVSQIQPHFMYNSLNSIYYLIEMNPELAQEAVSTFSQYLRQNINSIKNNSLIPVVEEIEHTKAYCYLEKLRFGDRINIVYNIRCTDFMIPPLTIQPLVENAIKHGLTVKPEGGTVWIDVYRDESSFHVVIKDDGVGFEAGSFHDEGSTHVGLFNVHARLKDLCSGVLTVESEVGKGTCSRIDIPVDSLHAKIKTY